jgi:hypothetical protein
VPIAATIGGRGEVVAANATIEREGNHGRIHRRRGSAAVGRGMATTTAIGLGQGAAAPIGDGEWHIGTATAGYGP